MVPCCVMKLTSLSLPQSNMKISMNSLRRGVINAPLYLKGHKESIVMQSSKANPSVVLGPNRQLIGGRWCDAADGRELEVESPAIKEVITSVPRSGPEDVNRAVRAAQNAFEKWRRVTPSERGKLFLKIADDLEANLEKLARIIAHETGNALRTQARTEANACVTIFRYFGGLVSELKGETLPLGDNLLSYTRREPFGVVGAIVPWNAPAMLASLKIAPALCAGNSLVL